MLTTYLIPLQGIAETFTINLAGVNYTMTVKWNDQMSLMDTGDTGWMLDISDSSQNPIVCGLPLITGDNILDGLDYLGIGGAMIVLTSGDPTAVPNFNNLGADCNLYFEVTS